MRDLATQKLSRAYHLDEIAASVATMQSTSSLEEVAKLVLQRCPNDSDAKYVHFFHEKIPSRMLAQSTDLTSLDEIIQDRPAEAAPLRTRGVTRIFKDDFLGAARDLTDGLAISRYAMSQHKAEAGQLALINPSGGFIGKVGDRRDSLYEGKLEDEDQPSGLEHQLLFQRAGVYLTLACQNIHQSLDGMNISDGHHDPAGGQSTMANDSGLEPSNRIANETRDRRTEARKLVKTYAKRALRDYTSFLSNFGYTPGLSAEVTAEFFRKVNVAAKGAPKDRPLEMSGNPELSDGNMTDALVPHKHSDIPHQSGRPSRDAILYPPLPPAEVYTVSSLFSSSPPPDLPPFPASQALIPRNASLQDQPPNWFGNPLWTQTDTFESVTYHPLLTDALHSLLLCHSLIQTSSKEHLRHAHMAARLARICDGYPIFVACRSPSRADWIEVIRRSNNWIGLQQSWETLCAPAPLPGHSGTTKREETETEAKERRMQESILEALADERVVDDASFHAAVAARERRAEEQRTDDLSQGGSSPKRWAQDDGKGYPMSTGRAELIARWVRDAPQVVEGSGKGKAGTKKGKGKKETA